MIFEILGLVTLGLASVLAFRFGGRDEQMAAIAFIGATLASRLVNTNYAHMEASVLLVDAVLLFGLILLALKSDRFWPMYAAAFQFVGTVVHVASMVETGNFAWAYAVGLIFWSYAVMAALMAGTWLEGRNRRLLGL
ncbi:hypothetical protein [Sandarakinorhabdus oryzae]|uniref:hypothetical protein n=1 Tax=Sandarakinorhabdus oryzae TaxID=2675220 RepID=UPI0012E2FE4F|nr:hypothetical protein [Sandarakinorhabdus oryzae]